MKGDVKIEENGYEFSIINKNYEFEVDKYDDGDIGITLDYKSVILTPEQINQLIDWLQNGKGVD